MRHINFGTSSTQKVAILVKPHVLKREEMMLNYVAPLSILGIGSNEIIGFSLETDNYKKVSQAFAKSYLEDLMPVMKDQGVEYLYVADSVYFKILTKQAKAEPHANYVLPCAIKGYEYMKVVLGVNYQQIIYDPSVGEKLIQSINALAKHMGGTYEEPGQGIIHKAYYPSTTEEIKSILEGLKAYPSLTCDIEAFSLRYWKAGIGTISFAKDKHNGVAFACDYKSFPAPLVVQEPNEDGVIVDKTIYGTYEPNHEVRKLLLEFFLTYKGKLTFHNAAYDVKVIIYVLWMKSLLDQEGLLSGLHHLAPMLEDTKIIKYLATNTTAGNVLGLKDSAHEFAGNWAKDDIKDIRMIPLKDLLEYNLVDALSTHWMLDRWYPVMVADQQEDIYRNLFMPSQKLIIQMEITGMPMSKRKIAEGKAKLEAIKAKQLLVIQNDQLIREATLNLRERKWRKDFEDRQAMAKNPDKIKPKDQAVFNNLEFNPGSNQQMQDLLYEVMGLPVIDLTDKKQPAVGADTLEKLKHHVKTQAEKDLMTSLIDFSKVQKILSTFIPAFEEAINKDPSKPDEVWLHGSFNLGGTVSGRLSSNSPNLQNLPAGSIYGKLIKEMFIGHSGWLFGGADFNSLEDYISALTTKDPNKLDVYIKGFDGHCLRAAYYFKDELIAEGINIDLADPKSVNSLKKMPQYSGKDHPLRQESKAPTFALTYQGTYATLMTNLGWTEVKAKAIEANYHILYQVSDEYIQGRLKQASKDGFAAVAFGLRVRTPLLAQVVFGSAKMPAAAAAEGRTVGNAMGQSYGLLNNRAAVEFFEKVWASPYATKILPCALIHDAIYTTFVEDLEIVKFVNDELIISMRWQNLPELYHPTVKLGAALDIFWPSWANAITLSNDCSNDEIIKTCRTGKEKYLKGEKE